MEVILKEDVKKIGKAGERVKVKDGYARNFLFPHNLALTANDGNLKLVESERLRKAAIHQKETEAAKLLADKISKASCTIRVKVGENEKLYGRVTTQDISNALEVEGITVDKKKIDISEPIDKLGVSYAQVKLHHEVTAQLKVWVVKE